MEFTFEAYRSLIDIIREKRYTITNYTDYKEYEKAVIIKHDVDMSLEKALQFAEFEHTLGISTTYNILLCSDFYNPYSKKNMERIMKIKELGHDIGLHFDEVRYQDHILENINHEIDILELFMGERVKSVSMHRPSAGSIEANLSIDGGNVVNTYAEEFFKEFKYVSDSRMNWREDPIKTVECGQYDKIHILTHPIWYTHQEETISERLKAFLDEALPERYDGLKDNIRNLNEIM